MSFLLLGLLVTLGLWILGRLWVRTRPATLRKLLPWMTAALLGLLALFLLRFGLVYGASVAAFLGAIYPLLSRWMPWLAGWWLMRRRQTTEEIPPTPRRRGQMTKKEARAILGVTEKADEDEIQAAYRRLIQKNHPDTGGSEYLAQQINEAKRVLLGTDS